CARAQSSLGSRHTPHSQLCVSHRRVYHICSVLALSLTPACTDQPLILSTRASTTPGRPAPRSKAPERRAPPRRHEPGRRRRRRPPRNAHPKLGLGARLWQHLRRHLLVRRAEGRRQRPELAAGGGGRAAGRR
ncbi:MAG: hypothetical protein J3K34DRAFT_519076, partial [Monoraphidium minutum]